MGAIPASANARVRVRFLRKHGFALRLAGSSLTIGIATYFIGSAPDTYFIWVANGVLLAYLLLAPRNRWPAYLAVGCVAQFAGGLYVFRQTILTGILLTFFNVSEALLSALLLRRRSSQLPDFTNPAYIVRFVAFGAFAGPIVIGTAESLLTLLGHLHSPFWRALSPGVDFVQWVVPDSLGACIATPACVAVFRTRFRHSLLSFKHWAYLLPVVICAFAVFSQGRMPIPFLLYPLLVLVLLRLDLGWASLSVLLVAAIGGFFTVRAYGPFAPSITVTPLASSIALQLFIASTLIVLYGISFVLETLRATERRLKETGALHKLVVENSRDAIVIADFEGRLRFVAPGPKQPGGWNPEDLKQSRNFDMVHPEDRHKVAAVFEELRSGKDGALVEWRGLRRDNSYIWVEASLRTIRDPVTGIPTGILASVREISARKTAEQKLADAYHAVEALAVTDPLTGLANRRRFDQFLLTEWRRALRDRKPLSLLLIDADLFKSYNDTYGHLRGDGCLKQIAEAAQDVVARSGDLVARFGGEEFAIVLPNTCNSGALQLAQDVCSVMRNRELAHSANPVGVVTVSIGCATLIPQQGQHVATLIDCADQALYEAKNTGRNRAVAYRCTADALDEGRNSGSLLPLESA